jgi:hypothetical protein
MALATSTMKSAFPIVLMLLAAVQCAAEEEACATPTLRYFDVRGRGEAIRLALHDQGVEFEDASFSSDECAWPGAQRR